jgi:dihydrolipoamide dehydrogenase
MADSYDVVVLGGGTGGYSCALHAANLGLSVALIEKEKVGGTCLHWGCIPTKAFLQAAEVAEHTRDSHHYGVQATFEGIDGARVLEYKDGVVNANHKGLQSELGRRGVDTITGSGRLSGPRTVAVDTSEGQRTIQAAKALVVATGSTPLDAPVEGAERDGDLVITSDEALYRQQAPQRPIVLGASAVGVEFASIWQGFGAEHVAIVELENALVPHEDVDTSKQLARDFRKAGIASHTGAKATKVDKGDGEVAVTVDTAKGQQTLDGDVLMVAIGRRPVTAGLGLEEAGIELDGGFVVVDEWCRTGVEGVYAIGDILPPPSLGLAHASFQEGMLVADQVAGQPARPIDYRGVPRVYYCHPEIGSVGYTEQELQQQGIAYDKTVFPFSHNGRAMMMRGTGHTKVLAAKDGGRVLGVHVIGPKATDLIAEAQLIYNWEALPTDVAEFIHPHPTLSEAVGEAHLALAGRQLHG